MKKKLLIILFIPCIFLMQTLVVHAATPKVATPPTFNAKEVQAIQSIVHDYLIKNPKVLLEMSRSLQDLKEQEMTQMQAETKTLLSKYTKDLLDTTQHAAIGNLNGDAILIEFFDYQCGHCKAMNAVIKQLLAKDHNLKVIFIEWPIFGASSIDIAQAALAAREQDKYLEIHDALLSATKPFTSLGQILKMAKSMGLNDKKLQQDMSSKKVQDILRNNRQLAKNLKLVAAPAFIFSNARGTKLDFILGQVDMVTLQKTIDKVRSK